MAQRPSNRADSEARSIGEAADYPRLPLQGGLHGLVEFGRLVEVDDVDVAVCGTDDQQLVLDVHGVDAFLALDRGDWCRLTQIPVFDGLVPRAGDQEWLAAHGGIGDHVAASNGRVMRGNLNGGRLACSEVEHAGCLVGTGTDHLGSILKRKKDVS